MGKIRGTHSSPGIYTQFTDLSYAAKSLGITTLGLVGETLKGPALEPVAISSWTQFVDYFGGTSPEKYKDSKYPKYELPYIAKSYLSASDQLYVCRVLGLSGYNAGPAFIITASDSDSDSDSKQVVAVLRSRGHYVKYANIGTCPTATTKYDQLVFDCDRIELANYSNPSILIQCNDGESSVSVSGTTSNFDINSLNYGQFDIIAYKSDLTDDEWKAVTDKTEYEVGRYSINLNSGTKDYIYNVLGSNANEGEACIFVEELYDYSLAYSIANTTINQIDSAVTIVKELTVNTICDPVSDAVTVLQKDLKRKHLGTTYICTTEQADADDEDVTFQYYPTDNNGVVLTNATPSDMTVGHIYTVKSYLTSANTKDYIYTEVKDKAGKAISVSKVSGETVDAVKVLSMDSFVCLNESGEVDTLKDMNDYHESFRCAMTPWIVSELKGNGANYQVKKLFRFHTITDGNFANEQVKVSIANIRPDEGLFDVYIRDFNDTDANKTILESFKNCNMVPGSSKYIGLKIGTLNGDYEIKSKYVMVEVIENDMTESCYPAGFLGYPMRTYSDGVSAPTVNYNITYDEDINAKKQYFGLSDIVGIDVDDFYYKGKYAYTDNYAEGYSEPFHLDSRLSESFRSSWAEEMSITLDGDSSTEGMNWQAVDVNNIPNGGSSPIIASEAEMADTIYADKNLRKFTVCFYGGFDGWDIYRGQRTNTDEFKASKYKGTISNGNGKTFSTIDNPIALSLSGKCITSDYYAYLAGAMQFENPEKNIINLFATPGIDYVNNTLLTNEILEIIEEKRGDSLYIMTTPDKPTSANDTVDEMYSSSDVVDNLEDAGIDTYYAATYYPWVKYYDSENNIYIQLPATKDVLRNMADVDNKKYPWYAPAGIERGKVECTKMHFFAKLEDEDNVYDGRINPLKTFSKDGVKVWGNKTMYTGDTPMNRINVVRLMLYMRKLVIEACRPLIFEPNDSTVKAQFESLVKPILAQIKSDRGITDYRLTTSQTTEQIDAHEMSATLFVKPTPDLEYIELNFVVTPQGVDFDEI